MSRSTVAALSLTLWSVSPRATETENAIIFREMLPDIGIDYRNQSGEPDKRYIVSSLGSGAALFDYDEDGDLDLYFVNGATLGSGSATAAPNRLYRNEGEWRFLDVTEAAGVGDTGWGLGCAVGDYDDDGLADLYVTQIGPNRLFRNRGDGTFQDVTETAGVGDERFGTSTLFFDADGDGDLDLYVTNYSQHEVSSLPLPGSGPNCVWFGIPVFCGPSGLSGVPDAYYRNEGDGTFREATREAGLFDETGAYGLGVVAGDVDNDGDMDLYVANDSVPNFLFQNDGSGRFTESALFSGVAYSADGLAQAGMGVDTADLDGDGWLDLHVTNFSHDHDTLYLNAGDGLFSDSTMGLDLRTATWFYLGWGTRIADFDNDGDQDLFAANGHVYPQADDTSQKTTYRQRNQLFWNESGSLLEKPWSAGDGMAAEASSRGAAFGDVDDDGDIDAVIVNIDDDPSLLRNESGGRSIVLELVGRASNRDAIGARLTARVGDDVRILEVRPSGSFLSSNDARVHLGLGATDELAGLTVRWPSGVEETLEGLPAGSRVTLVEGLGYAVRGGARP